MERMNQAKTTIAALALVALFGLTATAQAGGMSFETMVMGDVNFTSDLENPKIINIAKFDTMGGTRTLLDVLVEVCHSGSVDMAGDNDDPFQGAVVRGRMIRQYMLSGGGVFDSGGNIVNTGDAVLGADDGDGGDNDIFDPTGPDGVDFGTLSYGPITNASYFPGEALYAMDGGGTVSFTVTPVLMVNDQQFVDPPGAPDAWQLEVENPLMNVKVKVTYTWVPEPGTAGLLAIGALALMRRRR